MEVWENIDGFEGYQVSNLGNVKSLNYNNTNKPKLLKPKINKDNYYYVGLRKDKKAHTKKIHQLVAIAFLNHNPCGMEKVVNHKDFNKLNNSLSNLEIVTNRENCNKKHLKSTSKYTGVSYSKERKKWCSMIMINGKNKNLGRYNSEIEAHNAYQNALKNINN